MKREINVFDYATEIMNAVRKGVLITTKSGEKINPMTISWGMLGVEWNKPVFITFIREGRFTRTLLDESLNFTVNIPLGEYDRNIISYCGAHSGRDVDKAKALSLTMLDSDCIASPAVKELPLTLECKVLYKQMQDKNAIPRSVKADFYPAGVDAGNPLDNQDYHIAYYGEIVKAYVIE